MHWVMCCVMLSAGLERLADPIFNGDERTAVFEPLSVSPGVLFVPELCFLCRVT